MDMTPLRRTVLVMLLVSIPWFLVGIFSFSFLMQAHLEEGVKYTSGMKISIILGSVPCMLALALFVDGVRRKQINPLLILFALSGLWYLIEWPVRALLALLRP